MKDLCSWQYLTSSCAMGLIVLSAVIILVGLVDRGWIIGSNLVIIVVLSGIIFGICWCSSGLNLGQYMDLF